MVILANGFLFTLIRMFADRLVHDVPITIWHRRYDRVIFFFDSAILKLLPQRGMRLIRLGDQDDTTGVAVKPMHDPGPCRTTDRTE